MVLVLRSHWCSATITVTTSSELCHLRTTPSAAAAQPPQLLLLALSHPSQHPVCFDWPFWGLLRWGGGIEPLQPSQLALLLLRVISRKLKLQGACFGPSLLKRSARPVENTIVHSSRDQPLWCHCQLSHTNECHWLLRTLLLSGQGQAATRLLTRAPAGVGRSPPPLQPSPLVVLALRSHCGPSRRLLWLLWGGLQGKIPCLSSHPNKLAVMVQLSRPSHH